ncbi:MAG TPA: polysaccharide biosynthesis tyrosine autokinase, partial [Tepidisphaeraceae bacterium]|nr:polysaccharide biosynthesis tyrosine autokinase [Tepidisphaeraceae bacterium]
MTALNRALSKPEPPPQALAAETPRRSPLTVMWQRRWIILCCILLALLGAIVYLLPAVTTPIYAGYAKLVVEQNTPRIIASDPTAAMLAGSQNYLWTQCELMRSREILKLAMEEPGIRQLQSFDPGSDPVERLRNMVWATVGRRDDIITVTVESPYKDDAVRLANAVVVAFTRYHDRTRRSTARELLDLLQNKMTELNRELTDKRQKKLDFELQNPGLSLGANHVSPTLDRLARLSQALTETQLNTLNAQAAYDTARAMLDDPVKMRQMLETRQFKNETAQLRAELRQLQKQLAGLSQSYLPGFPELTAIQQSIRQLNEELAAEDRRVFEAYLAELEAKVQAEKRNQAQIEALLNEQKKEVLHLNKVSAQYSLLLSELASLERFADEIYSRIKQLSLTEDAGALNVRLVESAVSSGRPVKPRKDLTLLYALVVGALAGTGLAFLRDWTDQRLRSAEEVKHVLGLPVLGIVPHMSGARDVRQRGLHLHLEPMSDVAEAYRTIRTAVYFGQTGSIARTILITSPSPGDGKTTLVSNLAIAMAQAGNRILLLDADFRKPAQHRIFELDKTQGLSSVLAGQASLGQVIRQTPIAGLHVLPCGPIPANPSEILNSQTFADLLQELCGQYDHVLLDSPPVMPVTDARILAASCDATLLALRAERSTRKGALYTRDMLRDVGANILGVVVNDVPRKKGIYGYYYSYGESYQYGYGQQRRAAGGDSGAAAP